MSSYELFTSHSKVSVLVQRICNDIKGQILVSISSDGLIEGQLIIGLVIASKSGETTGKCKLECQVCDEKRNITCANVAVS